MFDPFDYLSLDSDPLPDTPDPDVYRSERTIPADSIDIFASNQLDRESQIYVPYSKLRNQRMGLYSELPQRLINIGIWLRQIAYEPVSLWWAAHQSTLHPSITDGLQSILQQQPQRFSDSTRQGWKMLLAAWGDTRREPDMEKYRIEAEARLSGWTPTLVRELAATYRPQIIVRPAFGISSPLTWASHGFPENVIHIDVEYPKPHAAVDLPDDQVPYAVVCFRENLDFAIALEREITGADRLHLHTSRAPDDGSELPDDGYGLTGPIVYFQKLMRRLYEINPDLAQTQFLSWPKQDDYIFARLRIWAAGSKILNAVDAADVFLSLSEHVFWGGTHQRDLLFALRDRWKDLSSAKRQAIEQRLLKGSFPWETRESEQNALAAYDRQSRLHWLSMSSVVFTFDLAATMEALKSIAPDWTSRAGDAAAASNAPEVFGITMDNRPDSILATPVPDILRRAQEISRTDYEARAQREPFLGLAIQRPVRALAALTHVGRCGEAPPWAWAAFLRAESRATDTPRMIRTIAARLGRLPATELNKITYYVADWMDRIGKRLYGDVAVALNGLWFAVIAALSSEAAETTVSSHRNGRSWADDALNAPVGKLYELVMKDPAKEGLQSGAGLPEHFAGRLDELLTLPGDLRRHAIVMLGFQLNWLFFIDPNWSRLRLVSLSTDLTPDSEALWDGIFWSGRVPPAPLFALLKEDVVSHIRHARRRKSHSTILAGFLLAGWKTQVGDKNYIFSNSEIREAIIHADNELRRRILWQLERWSLEPNGHWKKWVIPFFKSVWPKQRVLHTPEISSALANFALASGDLMPEVVTLILPRLVPIREGQLRLPIGDETPTLHPARAYPKATLDLLWAVLGEDSRLWPYGIDAVLELLSQSTETLADSRLSELRRRKEF